MVGACWSYAPLIHGGSYRLAWTRTYDAWSSQGEQHLGKWSIEREHLHCETW